MKNAPPGGEHFLRKAAKILIGNPLVREGGLHQRLLENQKPVIKTP